MSTQDPSPDMADALRDEARRQQGYKNEVENTSDDDASRLNKWANTTWSEANGHRPA